MGGNMRLRNKKTGEIREFDEIGGFILSDDYPSHYLANKTYNSLAKFNEDWEDYKPAEPLIEDEKIRKAVRAWAELVPSAQVRYDIHEGRLYTYSDYIMPYSISFPARLGLDEMTDYTIAELCGEEE